METRPELFEEVKLYKTPKDREKLDNQANLFAIINTLQQLEKAYIRDCITSNEYTNACRTLLTQYNTSFKLVENDFKTIEEFFRKYKLDCPIALARIKEGRPITVKDDKGNTIKCIADTVTLFITVMDKIRLNLRANDELQPEIRDLLDVMNRLSILPPNFEGKVKIQKWFTLMQSMSASAELDDAQARDLLFDLDSAFNELNRIIKE